MDIAKLTAIFSADTRDFDRGVRGVDGKLRDAQGRFMAAGRSAQSFWSNVGSVSLGNIAANVLQKISGHLTGLIKNSIESAASMEGLKRGLASVAGSSEEAERQLVRLREVAKSPGLGFREAIQGSVRLQAVGLKAELAEKSLAVFGNALATVGGRKEDLDGVTLALTQIVSKGKVSAEEINQIAERVPQIRKAMTDAFGTADTETLQKMNLSTTEFIDKISTELGKIPQLTGGASNAMDNFKDSIDSALVTLGGPLLEPLGKALEAISPMLGQVAQRVADFFGQIPQIASSLISGLSDSFKNAFGIIIGIVQSVGAQIVGWFTENLPLIKQTVTTVLTAIGDFWAAWGGTIKTIVSTAMNVILGVIKTVMQVINGDWQGAWETVKNVVINVLQNIPTIIGGLVGFVLQAVARLGISIVKGIIQGLIGLPERLVSVVKAGLQALWNLTGWLLSEAWKLGKAIVDGIWQGFLSLFDSISTRMVGKIQEMVAAQKAALEIKSPSKVFFRIGQEIARGLSLGIDSGISSVEGSMQKLLDATISKFSSRQRVVGTGGIDDARQKIADALQHQVEMLRDLAGGESALGAINRLLSNPQVAAMVDARTAALLRFNATLEDTLKLSRERVLGLPFGMRATGDETRPRVIGMPDDMRSNGETRARRVLPDLAAEARERAGQIADELTGIIGGAFDRLLSGGWRSFLGSLLDSARRTFSAIADEFINQMLRGTLGANQQGKAGGLIGLITGALSGLLGGAFGGGGSGTGGVGGLVSTTMAGFNPGGLIMRAAGGPVGAGQWAMVGEQGPELVRFGSQGNVFSNKDSQRMVGGSTVQNITINVPVARSSGYTSPKSRRQLAEEILGRLR